MENGQETAENTEECDGDSLVGTLTDIITSLEKCINGCEAIRERLFHTVSTGVEITREFEYGLAVGRLMELKAINSRLKKLLGVKQDTVKPKA